MTGPFTSFSLLCQFESDSLAFFNDQIQINCQNDRFSIPRVISKAFFDGQPDFSNFDSHIVALFLQSLLIDCPEASHGLMWRIKALSLSDQIQLIKLYNAHGVRNTLHFHKQLFIDFGKSVVQSIHSNTKDTKITDDIADLFHFLPSAFLEVPVQKENYGVIQVQDDTTFLEFKNLHTFLPTLVDSKRGPKVNTTMLFHPASYNDIDPTTIIIAKISNKLQRLGIASIDTSHGFSYCIQAKNAKSTKVLVDFSPFTNTEIQISPAYILASMAGCPILNTKDAIKQYLTSPKTFNLSKIPTNRTLSKVSGRKIFLAFTSEELPPMISDNLNLIDEIFKIFDCTIVQNQIDADIIIHYEKNDKYVTDTRKNLFLSDLIG